jgi:hypothetical protein
VTASPIDSPLCREALEVVEPLLGPVLLRHSLRTFELGAAYASKKRVDFDDEGLLLAALFHDIGLTDSHRDRAKPFTKAGARALDGFATRSGVPRARARYLAAAIELHMQLLPRWSWGPEVALLQIGAWMDVVHMRAWAVPRADRRRIPTSHPRRGLQREFNRRLLLACGSLSSVAGLVRPSPEPVRGPDLLETS